jgi:hypothetical protein
VETLRVAGLRGEARKILLRGKQKGKAKLREKCERWRDCGICRLHWHSNGFSHLLKCQTRSRESRNRVKLAVPPTESGLLLAEEVAWALVSVIRVNDGSADRILLRVRQVTRNTVRVAEVVLRIPIRSPTQTTRRATAVISMRTASAMAGRTTRSTWGAAILTAGRLMNPVPDSISVGVVGRIRPIDMILDHARGRVSCLKLPGSGCMRILTPGDHAGRSAATGGHRQTQQRSSNHHPNWHGSPPSVGLVGPVFRIDLCGPRGPCRKTCCLSIGHSFPATRVFHLERRPVTTSFFHTRCRV